MGIETAGDFSGIQFLLSRESKCFFPEIAPINFFLMGEDPVMVRPESGGIAVPDAMTRFGRGPRPGMEGIDREILKHDLRVLRIFLRNFFAQGTGELTAVRALKIAEDHNLDFGVGWAIRRSIGSQVLQGIRERTGLQIPNRPGQQVLAIGR